MPFVCPFSYTVFLWQISTMDDPFNKILLLPHFQNACEWMNENKENTNTLTLLLMFQYLYLNLESSFCSPNESIKLYDFLFHVVLKSWYWLSGVTSIGEKTCWFQSQRVALNAIAIIYLSRLKVINITRLNRYHRKEGSAYLLGP